MTAMVEISIVVCTHNRAEMLRETLQSLIALDTGGQFDYEVLVVDNASTDHTPAVLAEIAGVSPVPFRHVCEMQLGQVQARNRGISEARGRWIANFDDDQVAHVRWLLELYMLARQRSLRSVGGAMRLRLPEEVQRNLHPVCRRVLGASVEWDEPRPYTHKEGPGSGNQLLHRSVYDEVGLYDHAYNLRGYDTDHYRRMRAAGIQSWFTPRALAWHITPPSRLEETYFRSTSRHNGWCFARRDRQEWGALRQWGLTAARLGQAAMVTFPRLAAATLRQDAEGQLAARCLLWRLQGYLQGAAESLREDLRRRFVPGALIHRKSKRGQVACASKP